MIPQIRFLWKQLRGPQITAICNAIHDFIKNMFNGKMDYFNNFTIESVNDSHLTLLGTLIGFERPLITEEHAKFFFFSDGPESNFENGFSDGPGHGESTEGGKLVDLWDILQGNHSILLPEEFYRGLLEVYTKSEGELGSIILLDDLLDYIYTKYRSEDEKDYEFKWCTQSELRGNQDIELWVGSISNWPADKIVEIDTVINTVSKRGYLPSTAIYNIYQTS